jgi:hypothetical protein
LRIWDDPNPKRQRGIAISRSDSFPAKSLAHASGCDGLLHFCMS